MSPAAVGRAEVLRLRAAARVEGVGPDPDDEAAWRTLLSRAVPGDALPAAEALALARAAARLSFAAADGGGAAPAAALLPRRPS